MSVGASPRTKKPPSQRPLERALARELGDGAPRIVWTDAGDEVLVHLDSLRVHNDGGCLQIAIDLEADEIARERLVVRFALGRVHGKQLLGATEEAPGATANGNRPPLAGRWGEALQHGLWAALVAIAAAPAVARRTNGYRELEAALKQRGRAR